MSNPLAEPVEKVWPDLTGRHVCILDDIPVVDAKKFDSNEMEKKLAWKFKLDLDYGTEKGTITKRTSTSTWAGKPESGFTTLLKELAPKKFKTLAKMKDGKYLEREPAWALAEELIGQKFILSVVNEKGWNNYADGEPFTEERWKEVQAEDAAEAKKDKKNAVDFKDDQIPF